jgi:hypothetical protein
MNEPKIAKESFFRMKKSFSREDTEKALTELGKGKSTDSPLKGLGGLGHLQAPKKEVPKKDNKREEQSSLAESINHTLTAILDNQRIMDKLNEILEIVKSSNEKEILQKIDTRINTEKLSIVITPDDYVDTIHAKSLKDAIFKLASRLTTEEEQEHKRIVDNESDEESD